MEIKYVLVPLMMLLANKNARGEPIDKNATKETRILFYRLQKLAQNPDKIIFGQQRATQNGIYGWKPPYRHEHAGGWAYTVKYLFRHT